jgi:HD-GYP domain-containing protein (c-di-GMP phosphodiesterase class II)
MRLVPRELVLALGALLGLVPIVAIAVAGERDITVGASTHFYFVGLTAAAATAAAIALTVAGARQEDGRTVVVGTAFGVMAALLVIHGIATPSVLIGDNGVIAFSGGATLPVGAVLLGLCTLPHFRGPRAVRPLIRLQALLMAGVLALGFVGMLAPGFVPAVPEPRSPVAWAALAVGLGFYGLVGWRAFRTFRLTHRAGDLLVVVGIAWLAAALPAALLLTWVDLGWWIGHGLEVLGIGAVGLTVALDLRRSAQSRTLLGDLRAGELVAAEEAFLGAQVRSLMVRLASKDGSTEEHTRRVALRAVQVGEELGLSAGRLRVLAAGGLLHDMGKLSVPDTILKKPGPLTDRQFRIVKRHPEWGNELLAQLGFGGDVRRLVLDHHERLDGSGYPRGRHGDDLDLETRILAVCDVYDALVSPRVYRSAWSHADAMALLRSDDERAKFDERCVAALERVLGGTQLDSAALVAV